MWHGQGRQLRLHLGSQPDGGPASHSTDAVGRFPQLGAQLLHLTSQGIEIIGSGIEFGKTLSIRGGGLQQIVKGRRAGPQQALNRRQPSPQFFETLRIGLGAGGMAGH